jgi:hypothetical protein
MADNKPEEGKQPRRISPVRVVLIFLVFLVLTFVVFMMVTGLGEQDLSSGNTWLLTLAMVLLLLLPVVDRIREISLSPTEGFAAQLSEIQALAMEQVGARVEDPEVVKTARQQILQARSPDQVQAAVEDAVKLNVTRTIEAVTDAIQNRHKCYVRYRPVPDEPVQTYHVAPLDIKPGKTPATKEKDYLWAHSYEHEDTVSLRLDRVLGVEQSAETFDPAEVMAGWKKQPAWSVKRDW